MRTPRNVLWQANSDFQRSVLACSARYALAGGGAGSGKSVCLNACAAQQTPNPKHRAIIFRRDYPSLKHIISAAMAVFIPMRARYNKQEHTFYFPSGSTIEFSHLEDETAMYQHAGKEYSFIGFDELTQLPGDSVDSRGQPINSAFSFLQSRLRSPKDSGLRLEVRCTATPGGPGHGWVKAFFRIPDSGESTEFIHEVTGYRHCYFRGTVASNPALAGTDYERQLADQPVALRKALLHGDWSSYVGQVFTEWGYREHTCEPFAIPAGFELWRGADDAFAGKAAVLWCALDPVHDRVFVVHEMVASGMTAAVMAAEVLRIDRSLPINCGYNGVIEHGQALRGVIDSASFADTGYGGRADQMNKLGCGWKPCTKGANSRLTGKNMIHQRLAMKADGRPGLVIFRSCRNLIRELPMLCYDRKNPEDIDQRSPDDCYDALRYSLLYKPVQGGMVHIGAQDLPPGAGYEPQPTAGRCRVHF